MWPHSVSQKGIVAPDGEKNGSWQRAQLTNSQKSNSGGATDKFDIWRRGGEKSSDRDIVFTCISRGSCWHVARVWSLDQIRFDSNAQRACSLQRRAMDGGKASILTTKGWSLPFLLSKGKRFRPVPRISASDSALQARLDDCETSGEPLVVESFQKHKAWPIQVFTVDYFRQHIDQTSKRPFLFDTDTIFISIGIGVRDIHSLADHIVTFDDFIEHCKDCRPFITPGG